ncbi:MAG: Eco57I restriction-modification methylase domain-containing protein [Campylobacterota bacterium]|nr:Eco57I restriction-modification methylase domain-containing protein [Campylobacterota bacterium]
MKNIIRYQVKSSIEYLALNRHLAKLGSGALAPPFDEAKAIVSDEFCKNSNNSIKIENIKVLIVSDDVDLYKNILVKLNVNSENIRTITISNFDFFTKESLIDNSFDLIIGNPPNTRQEKLKSIKPLLLEYESYFETADLNVYLFEKGFRLLKEGGVLSYYIDSKYKKARYAKNFRNFILNNVNILEYIDFDDKSILTYQKSKEKSVDFSYCKITNKCKNITDFIDKNSYKYLINDLSIKEFKFLSLKQIEIKHKIENMGLLNILSFLNYRVVNFYKYIINFEDIDKLKSFEISKEAQKPFEILVDYILFAKEKNMSLEASLFESIIDGMVYDLYFEEEMKKGDCFISDEVKKVLGEFDSEKIEEVYKVFKNNKTVQRGLIYSRIVSVVEVINGAKK